MNRSKKQLIDSLTRPKEELEEIIRYLCMWSAFGDTRTYYRFMVLCGNTTYESDNAAYNSTIDLLYSLNDIQIANVHEKLKQAGLLTEPYYYIRRFQ